MTVITNTHIEIKDKDNLKRLLFLYIEYNPD